MEANQRLRLIGAGAALVAERGIAQITAREIARRAGVSPSTLYAIFPGADAVLAAGAELAAASLSGVVSEACGGAEDDEEKVLAAVLAACGWASREAESAALLALAPAVAIAEVAATRERLVAGLAASLTRLRQRRDGSTDPEVQVLMVSAAVTIVSERASTLGADDARALGLELAALLD